MCIITPCSAYYIPILSGLVCLISFLIKQGKSLYPWRFCQCLQRLLISKTIKQLGSGLLCLNHQFPFQHLSIFLNDVPMIYASIPEAFLRG